MRILLATANLDDVRWGVETGLADGIATSPAQLSESGSGAWPDVLIDLCRASSLPVTACVGAISARDIYHEGRELAKLSDQIVIQVPLVEDAVVAIRKLRADGVRVTASLVVTAAQALLAAKTGATGVSIPLAALAGVGLGPAAALRDVRAALRSDETECDLIASLPRDAAQFTECALAGADAVTVTPALLHALLVHPLTDRGLDQFLADISHHRPRGPA